MKQIRVTGVRRKPLDVSGLAVALSDLASHLHRREAKQKRRAAKAPRGEDDHA